MEVLFLGEIDNPVYKWLIKSNETVFCSNDKVDLEFIQKNKFEFLISYGYRHILSEDVLLFFKEKAINLHISLLPYNRGSDPNFWSFLEKSPKGVTIHLIDKGLDTGNILVQKEIKINSKKYSLKTSYDLLKLEIENLFFKNWNSIKNQKIIPKKQKGKGSFHLKKDIQKYNYLIQKNGWDTMCNKIEKKEI
jgi:methionyl-tRNA formyltransferase